MNQRKLLHYILWIKPNFLFFFLKIWTKKIITLLKNLSTMTRFPKPHRTLCKARLKLWQPITKNWELLTDWNYRTPLYAKPTTILLLFLIISKLGFQVQFFKSKVFIWLVIAKCSKMEKKKITSTKNQLKNKLNTGARTFLSSILLSFRKFQFS